MRILITQRALIHRAGSELVTIEVAKELSDRGHEVAVFCPRAGDLAKVMYSSGVWVKPRLSEIPWTPDVIHGQHHLQAIAALSYFTRTPAIYYCHGVSPWVEQAPIHPRIRKYLVVCGWMVRRFAPEYGIPADSVAVVQNFVNTKRFSEYRQHSEKRQRALLFGGSRLPDHELAKLEAACTEEGLSLDRIGSAYGNPVAQPEAVLPGYDVVFAIGKSALEALACGCAVIPILPGLAGGLITSTNLDDWAYSNFSPRYFTSAAQVGGPWLHKELIGYSVEDLAKLAARVRSAFSLSSAVDRLEAVYAEAVGGTTPAEKTAPSEFAAYLETLSHDADLMWSELQELRQRASANAARLAASAKELQGLRERLRADTGRLAAANVNADAIAAAQQARSPWRRRVKQWKRRMVASIRGTKGDNPDQTSKAPGGRVRRRNRPK